MALRNSITASRYLPFSKKRWPLSKYFCLRTLGSREQADKTAAKHTTTQRRRNREERVIANISIRKITVSEPCLKVTAVTGGPVLSRDVVIDQWNDVAREPLQPLLR